MDKNTRSVSRLHNRKTWNLINFFVDHKLLLLDTFLQDNSNSSCDIEILRKP